MENNIICKECGASLKSIKSLINHIRYNHKEINSKKYYDKHLKTNIFENICLTCGKSTKFLSITKGYRIFCSRKCTNNNDTIKQKIKNTFKSKYGVENPFQSTLVKKKIKDTCKKKYGVEYISKNKDIQQKIKDTCINKYGVDSYNKTEEAKNRRKDTCINKYGVDNPSQNILIKEKKKVTCLKNYEVENPSQNILIKEKKKVTCLKNYTVENPNQSKEIKDKIKITCLEKYGTYYTFQSDIIKKKIKDTCIKKYGVENPNQNKEIRKKSKETYLKHNLPLVKKVLKSLNIEIISEYNGTQKNISLKCLVCNTEFKSSYFNMQRGCGRCPNCYPKYKSIAEQEILNFINGLSIETINNSRKIISPYEIDIYIPEKKIAIEYNGLYWHSENCGKDKNYHLNKLNKCLENDINLIQIFEDEWIYKQDIVKSRLKQILGVNKCSSYSSEKVYARKCIIREIDSKIKNKFLENYHLQGKDNSFIKLGAFFNEELISVMTFSKGNIAKGSFSKEGVWELNRFCSYSNLHIPGIASKLLSYFKRNYCWKEIFSYADRRWSIGNLYYKLGFSLENVTKPNYWYTKGFNRIHRFNFRKKPEEPKDIPEWMLRLEEGYSRVWDCGHLKFVLKGNI